MRQIYKSQEPESFTNWKTIQRNTPNLHYRYLQNPLKRELHDFLVEEQGHICCYCEIRIAQESSHIEHLKPQSKCTNEETLEYTNLLACCQGEGEVSRRPEHCGQKRLNAPIAITPFDAICIEAFRFTEDGQILATEEPLIQEAAESTISVLALNIPKLQRMRKAAIRANLRDIEFLSQSEIQKLISAFDNKNSDGKYEEFCSAVVYQLKQFI